jgi:hypothetical protein
VGRPSLGNQARTIQQNTKISREEQTWLEGLHGSAGKGMRAALDAYKVAMLRAAGTEVAGDYADALEHTDEPLWVPPADYRPVVDVELPAPTGPRPVVPVDEDGTPIPCRIHRKFEIIAEFYDKGVAMREKRCVKCGHVVAERAA